MVFVELKIHQNYIFERGGTLRPGSDRSLHFVMLAGRPDDGTLPLRYHRRPFGANVTHICCRKSKKKYSNKKKQYVYLAGKCRKNQKQSILDDLNYIENDKDFFGECSLSLFVHDWGF